MLNGLDAVSRADILDGAAALLASSLGVASVLLGESEQSLNSLLVY